MFGSATAAPFRVARRKSTWLRSSLAISCREAADRVVGERHHAAAGDGSRRALAAGLVGAEARAVDGAEIEFRLEIFEVEREVQDVVVVHAFFHDGAVGERRKRACAERRDRGQARLENEPPVRSRIGVRAGWFQSWVSPLCLGGKLRRRHHRRGIFLTSSYAVRGEWITGEGIIILISRRYSALPYDQYTDL